MKWTPEPFKHTACITVTKDLSADLTVDVTVDDIAPEDAVAATEYFAEQLDDLVKRRKSKRRRPRKKTPQPSPTEQSP